jgi:CBS domain-containing protein
MKVGEYCNRNVVTVTSTQNLVEAARLMRDQHVGFLVVVDAEAERLRPVGVLTDRDIVVQVTAREVDARALTVGDVMVREPVMAGVQDDLEELLQRLRVAGVRRAPVIDLRGTLVGVIALDDAIHIVTGLLGDITGSIQHEQRVERQLRTS